MRKRIFFFQVRIGDLFFRDNSEDAVPYVKVSDDKARTPSGKIEDFTEQTLVFQSNVRVRV